MSLWPWDSIIQGGAQIASAKMQSDAMNNATRSQERSTQEALQFERDKENAKRLQWQAYQAGRQFLLQRYGVDVGSAFTPTLPGVKGGPSVGEPNYRQPRPDGIPTPGGGAVNRPYGTSIGAMIGQPQGAQPQAQAPVELGKWNDWSQFNVGAPRG